MYRIIALLAAAAMVFTTGCRDTATSSYAPAFEFAQPQTIKLPSETKYAEKRGFDDFNCDGVEDMLEIKDDAWVGQDYKVRVFWGQRDKDTGLISFQDEPTILDMPIKLKWFSSATKMDVGDVNGDCFADIIFTQYVERWGEDTMKVAFALNRNGNSFEHYDSTVTYSGGSLGAKIWSWAARHNRDEEESLYDYLKMDWGDIDGDGADDLLLAWDDYRDLDVFVLYTELDKSGSRVGVRAEGKDRIDGFMASRSIRNFDIEDFNGDGKQDIFMRRDHMGGERVTATVAVNQGNTNFSPHQDFKLTDTDMAMIGFEKRDTWDVNGDGCADFVHLGVYKGQDTMSYNLVACSAQ